MRHCNQTQKDAKTDRITKLKREIEYSERGMQRIRMTLTKLQQYPTQTQVTSGVCSRLKKIICQKDHNDKREEGGNQESYLDNSNPGPYPSKCGRWVV